MEMTIPVGMFRNFFQALIRFSDVPKPGRTVIPASGKVILFVGIEVNVPDLKLVGSLELPRFLHISRVHASH